MPNVHRIDDSAGGRPRGLRLARRTLCAIIVVTASAGAAAQHRYLIRDLTEMAAPFGVAQCEGTAINESGEIVGYEVLPEYRSRAIYWDNELGVRILPLLPGDNSSWSHAINDDGSVAGVSSEVTIEHIGHLIRIIEDNKAVTWNAATGELTKLSDLVIGGDPIDIERAWSLNNDGLIAGWGRPAGSPTGSKGWLFEAGNLTDLGPVEEPTAMNSRRQIVGQPLAGQAHAWLWDNGVLTELHDHPLIQGVTSRAWGINEAGQVVGEAQFFISHPEAPVLWENGEPVNLVGHLFSRPQGIATAINNDGLIVGLVTDLDNLNDPWHGFLIDDGEFYDLIDLIPQDLGWEQLTLPWDINDRGQIVGGGLRNGQLGHGFLLIPIEKGDLNCDGAIDAFDIEPFILAMTDPEAYGRQYPDCAAGFADVNEDGAVDAFDIEPFVALLTGP